MWIINNYTDTCPVESVESIVAIPIYYNVFQSSTFDFWDDPGEDIYTFEDGEPI